MRTMAVWIGAVLIAGGLWSTSLISHGLADEPAAPSSSSEATGGAAGKETSAVETVPPVVEGEPGPPSEAGEVQERTVSLPQPVHFTDAKGQDVVVGPGSYRVEAEGTNRIHLLPAGTGGAVVIDAVSFTHQQAVENPVPVTVPDPEQPDVLHLALLSPGGTGLDAIGTYSGVKPRAVTNFSAVLALGTFSVMPTAPPVVPSVPILRRPIDAAPTTGTMAPPERPSVVIHENPNFGGRSQTLGVGGHILSDFNDMASSIGVSPGLVALLYEHVDAGGGYGLSVDLLEDRPDLAQVNFNDKLSYVCVFSSPTPQGFIWARASVQNGQFVAGHWERQRASGTPVNPTAVVAPPLPPHPANAPPASCGGGPIVRDHRTPPFNPTPSLVPNTRIRNVGPPDRYVHIENGSAYAGAIQPGWLSAMWTFEPVAPGSTLTRIRNVFKPDQYLNIESGRLEASAIQEGWLSAQWTLEPVAQKPGLVTIRNVWKPNLYMKILINNTLNYAFLVADALYSGGNWEESGNWWSIEAVPGVNPKTNGIEQCGIELDCPIGYYAFTYWYTSKCPRVGTPVNGTSCMPYGAGQTVFLACDGPAIEMCPTGYHATSFQYAARCNRQTTSGSQVRNQFTCEINNAASFLACGKCPSGYQTLGTRPNTVTCGSYQEVSCQRQP